MKKTVKITLIIIFILLVLYLSLYLIAKVCPKLSINKENKYYFYDVNENLYPTYSLNEYVTLDNISPYLINATISIEDKNFYKHIGFDYLRIIKVFFKNMTSNNIEGASTITQQYAKNLYLNFDKTLKRKIEEAWLAIRLEVAYSKNEILEGYLNTINYGGVFGIENASKYYFGKSAKDLTLSEAAMLAGIPKSPNNYSPLKNEENANNRQKTVLKSMYKNKYITYEEYINAYNEELTYINFVKNNNSNTIMYFIDGVLNELDKINIPSSFLTTGGLKIYTTLNYDYQLSLENNVKNYYENSDIQVSGMIINPNNGEINALIGGKNYYESEYNRALYSKRAIGSTIKPFLYYAALENGMTASSTFTSEETNFVFSNSEIYSPKNYGNKYPNSLISLVSAIAYSDNIFAVKTHLFLGENTLVNTLKNVGIKEDIEALPSLALGSEGITLYDLMQGYSTLANLGEKNTIHFIKKIIDSNNNILYEFKEEKEQVLNKSYTYILNEMLTSTTNSSFIDYSYPTCISIASKLKEKYSIKSGTTNSDNLIVGYNKNVLLGLWSGYDNNNDITSNNSYNLKQTWADIASSFNNENSWYDMPNDVIGVIIDPISGKLATNDSKKTLMYYIKGTEPK